jgi:hypothetical protein
MSLQKVVDRDQKNAEMAQRLAVTQIGTIPLGVAGQSAANYANSRRKSLEAIRLKPFDVMIEGEFEDRDGNIHEFLWYGNAGVQANLPLSGVGVPAVLAWTHPGLQAALVTSLGEEEYLDNPNFRMESVSPKVRARFDSTHPTIRGIYEPWGTVGPAAESKQARKTGLKSVKLNMTAVQVRAFTSQMQGVMLVTGAPGSGKTTIAYQRIRFLLDQQEDAVNLPIKYDIGGVRIFLANQNLFHYSKALLEGELDIPGRVVQLVPEFMSEYLDSVWQNKWNARPIQRKTTRVEDRARDALFGLCKTDDLNKCWSVYESQVITRLQSNRHMTWAILTKGIDQSKTANLQKSLASYANSCKTAITPLKSSVRMDPLFRAIGDSYLKLRKTLDSKSQSKFDSEFAKWLFYVYDPVLATHTYLSEHRYPAQTRIERGIAGRGNGDHLLKQVLEDLDDRRYGSAEHGIFSFLLRFALPEEMEASLRFKNVPTAWPDHDSLWSHVVIDEAQDLSAPEAALLASLVDPRGAITISADFRQRVSASHGIEDSESIDLGCRISTTGMRKPFRFGTNKRQTPQIVEFLKAYYEVNFGEVPPFDADPNAAPGSPPELFIGNQLKIVERLQQLTKLPSLKSGSVAVLQVNENSEEKARIVGFLESIGITPVIPTKGDGTGNHWILATVEEIKGLEFDTCLVFGLDSVDADELDYNRNRAYVALSRPAQRLVMLCHEFPTILKGIPAPLYHRKDTRP